MGGNGGAAGVAEGLGRKVEKLLFWRKESLGSGRGGPDPGESSALCSLRVEKVTLHLVLAELIEHEISGVGNDGERRPPFLFGEGLGHHTATGLV